jgi:hypothetical protein
MCVRVPVARFYDIRSRDPERCQPQFDRVERLGANGDVASMCGEEPPSSRIEPEDLESLQNGLIEFHAFAPAPMADFNLMPPSRDPNAAIAIPAVISTATQSSLRMATQSVAESPESSRPIEANVVQPAQVSTETLPVTTTEPPVGHVPLDQ